MNALKNIALIISPLVLPTIIVTICLIQKYREDSRYGLHPFTKIIAFQTKYHWTDQTGRKHKYNSGNELRGSFARKLSDNKTHVCYYGEGAIKTWMNSYLKYICENTLFGKPQSCQAEVEYIINPTSERGLDSENYLKLEFSYYNS